MTFHVTHRWGECEREPSVERRREVLNELDAEDVEHTSVSLTHESELCLGVYPGGSVVWENLEGDNPRHMNNVPRERVLELWQALAQGRIGEI